jgi:hypothetical protein
VVYAYLFLFGTDTKPDIYDQRVLIACHIYNIGLAHTLRAEDSDRIDLGARVLALPRGRVTIASSRPGFPWDESQFSEFIAAAEYVIRGVSSRALPQTVLLRDLENTVCLSNERKSRILCLREVFTRALKQCLQRERSSHDGCRIEIIG